MNVLYIYLHRVYWIVVLHFRFDNVFILCLLRRFVRRGGIWTGFAWHICCVGLQRHVNHVFHLVATRIHPCVQKKEHTGNCNIKNDGLQMYGWEHIGRHGESEYVALTIAIQTPRWWKCVWEANTWKGGGCGCEYAIEECTYTINCTWLRILGASIIGFDFGDCRMFNIYRTRQRYLR